VLNDYSDRIADAISGKENVVSTLKGWQQVFVLATILFVGSISFIPFYQHKLAVVFLFLCYLSSTLYSTRPLRLKERGIWGVMCVSLAQRAFPVLIVFAIFEHFEFDALVFAVLSFLIGVRWILVHQILDYDKDVQANVKTFVASRTPMRAYNLLLFFFALEFVSTTVFVGMIYTAMPVVLFLIIAYFIYNLYLYPLWRKLGFRRMLTSYDFAPLADFYYLWLPLLLSIFLGRLNPWFFIVVVLEILWKVRYVKFDLGLIKLRRRCF
jgi:hypothetical protein